MVDLIGLARDHYQWVFSGIGVYLLAGIVSLITAVVALMRRRASPAVSQRQHGGAFSRNVQVGIIHRGGDRDE